MNKTNIVMLVADQMRCDSLHHMGNPGAVTPVLDRLANEGVSFQNAYCQNPVCVPSRCSFLSGLYPHTTGHRTMHYLQREYEHNILKEMKQNGYEVVWIGRNDLLMPGMSKENYCHEFYNGVDGQVHMEDREKYQYPKASYETPELMKDSSVYSFYHGKLNQEEAGRTYDWNCIRSALDYLDRKAKEKNPKPFFLYVSIFFPHPPYECEDPWFGSIRRDSLPPRRPDVELLQKPSMLKEIREKQGLKGWDERQYDELRATYLAMVSRFDYQAGLLCEKMKETGVYDDTSFIITSDHGDYTGDYGIVEKVQNCFEDPIANVPLIIKPAKRLRGRTGILKEVVELVDLPATLADIGGFSLSYTQFGESLLHVIVGKERKKTSALCEGGRIRGEIQAMESGHKQESPYWPRLSTQEKEGPQHTKAVMFREGDFKYVFRLYEEDELYDLENDPQELRNVIHEKGYEETARQLQYRLLARLFETSDVVPVEEDVRINW